MNIKDFKPSKSSRYNQGYINAGSCKKIFPQFSRDKVIYRSSYEKTFIYWCERSPKIKHWASECISIPYINYEDGQWHHYFPDFFVEYSDGTYAVIEIKPSSQTHQPVNENGWFAKEWRKNYCKWKSTKEFCDSKGWDFKILTEKTINQMY